MDNSLIYGAYLSGRRLKELSSEEYFYQMLGAVPPMFQAQNVVMLGEPYTHLSTGEVLSTVVFKQGQEYFATFATLKEVKAKAYLDFELV